MKIFWFCLWFERLWAFGLLAPIHIILAQDCGGVVSCSDALPVSTGYGRELG